MGHDPPVREQGRTVGALGWDGSAVGQPLAPQSPHLLSWQASVPRVTLRGRKRSEHHLPLTQGTGPPFRPPWQRGYLPVCQGGHGGPPHPAKRDMLSSGAWGERRGSWVLSRQSLHIRTPSSPAEHHPSCCPSASHTRDPAPTLSPGTPGEPASPWAPFTPLLPGSPGSPCQEGHSGQRVLCLTKPAPE